MTVPRYLLDTNILSNLIRQPAGAVTRKIASVGEMAICTSIVVACELRYGAAKKQSPLLSGKVEELLNTLDVLPLSEEVDRHYADIRFQLEASGQPIGPNDLLIAAHARVLDLTLVTDNVREFSRVPELRVENWLESPDSDR
ncbi:MAG TPA: type II toxin-antitoxin system VapC family toxin [Candidatus Competibacteraceae bacterium]|nr:type II toxin-antitoxin system VapC family toxin [Candidatus Competibacteraceae bacterium]